MSLAVLSPTRHLMRWPVGAWLAGLGIVLFIRFPVKFLLEPPYLMDFDVFRTVATRVVAGQGAQLYESTGSARMMFKYAPIWALGIAPLAWIPPQVGMVFWAGLSVTALLAICWASDRLLRLSGLSPPPF